MKSFAQLLLILGLAVLTQAQTTARVSESGLRMFASKTVMPIYPEGAISMHQTGVAVAELVVDENGHVSQVNVLEAPAASIESSILRALAQWQFGPVTTGGHPSRIVGKLTFYCVIKDGRGVVLNPEQVSYVGRWPEKPTRSAAKR